MLLKQSISTIENPSAKKTRKAAIKADSVIFSLLSRKLYKRPIEAVIREVFSNAIDAHQEAGILETVPVRITMPDVGINRFAIRDFGPGMSEYDMIGNEDDPGIYLYYGESTKRKKENSIGGLGLGTKSPLAYTHAFTVTSWHDGTRSEYMIYIDADDEPSADLVSTEPCGAETGIEVSFGLLQPSDWVNFIDAGTKVLKHFPRHWFEFNDVGGYISAEMLTVDILRDLGSVLFEQGTGIEVQIGHVRYEVDVRDLKELTGRMHREDIAFSLPVGDGEAWYDTLEILRTMSEYERVILRSNSLHEFDVYPNRESIVTSKRNLKAITRALSEGLRTMLGNPNEVNLNRDVFFARQNTTYGKSDLGGIFALPCDAYVVQAVHANRIWSSNRSISNLQTTYGQLVRTLANEKNSTVKFAEMTRPTLSDFLGSGRKATRNCGSREYPKVWQKPETLVFANPEKTDERLMSHLAEIYQEYPEAKVESDISEYEKSMEIEVQRQTEARIRAPREVVRSMSDPKHNILTLSASCTYLSGVPNGSRKRDWESSEENVKTLKARGGRIMWIPTRMGVAKPPNDLQTEFIFSINPLLPPHLRVTVIGLPASKGTKMVEEAFPSLEKAFDGWYAEIQKSPWLRRRMAWIKARDTIFGFRSDRYSGNSMIAAAEFTREFDQSNRIHKIEKKGTTLAYRVRTKSGYYWDNLVAAMPEISTNVECAFVYSMFVAPLREHSIYDKRKKPSAHGRLAHMHLETIACQTGNSRKGVTR